VSRTWIGLASLAPVLLIAGCSGAAAPATTRAGAGATTAAVTSTTTTTTAPPTTTTPSTPTTSTTLAPVPDALPIVDDGWDWVELLPVAGAGNVRYDGTYLVYREPDGGSVLVTENGRTILEHTPPDGREWIVQDVELGDHWVGILSNTETDPRTAQVVVYDLATGETVVDERSGDAGGPFSLPSIAISGRYLAMNDGGPESGCVDVYDLGIVGANGDVIRIGRICQDDPVQSIEMDGGDVAFAAHAGACTTVWTGQVYGGGEHHGLTAHTNRACWSNAPAASSPITLWFESAPQSSSGIDTLLGENPAGATVSLGKGVRGTAEACWGRAVWVGANGDVRFWDGGDAVHTIFSAAPAASLGCVGPWATVATGDAIYATNLLTGTAIDACSVVATAGRAQVTDLEAALLEWVHAYHEEAPADLEASVGGAVGQDGWWLGAGSFSDYFESAVFVWYPDGNVGVAWAGSADSVYDLRQYMFSVLPEAPPAVLGCVDVAGFAAS
jgi:hypothetical protein